MSLLSLHFLGILDEISFSQRFTLVHQTPQVVFKHAASASTVDCHGWPMHHINYGFHIHIHHIDYGLNMNSQPS